MYSLDRSNNPSVLTPVALLTGARTEGSLIPASSVEIPELTSIKVTLTLPLPSAVLWLNCPDQKVAVSMSGC